MPEHVLDLWHPMFFRAAGFKRGLLWRRFLLAGLLLGGASCLGSDGETHGLLSLHELSVEVGAGIRSCRDSGKAIEVELTLEGLVFALLEVGWNNVFHEFV